jgi:hypothetical protein
MRNKSAEDLSVEEIRFLLVEKCRASRNCWIYVPFVSLLDDYKHRNDPLLPPISCQVCGQVGSNSKSEIRF